MKNLALSETRYGLLKEIMEFEAKNGLNIQILTFKIKYLK